MSKNKKPDKNGFVFSTDPDFHFDKDEKQHAATLPPKQQKLKIRLDTKQRRGKSVTLIDGFSGLAEDIELLGKQLKNYCGTGGAVKDGQVIIQGDQRDKVFQWLIKNEYTAAKKM